MKQQISLFAKGFLIGIAFIIPGVSGGTLAIYLGIYDKLLHAIGNVFKEFKKSVLFLLPVFLGIAISVVSLAKLLGILLNLNSMMILFFFVGLILGGLKSLSQEVKHEPVKPSHVVAFLLSIALVAMLLIFKMVGSGSTTSIQVTFGTMILLFFIGMAASTTMIIPGISGSALLMVLGFYTLIVTDVIGNILDFSQLSSHLSVLIPFGLGAAAGIVIFSRVIEYALKHYKVITYYAIIGFVIASAVVILFEIHDQQSALLYDNQNPIYVDFGRYLLNNGWTLLGAAATFVVGFFAARKLEGLVQQEG